MPSHALDTVLIKQIGAVLDVQIEAVGAVGQEQCEVKLGGSALGQERLHLEPIQPNKRGLLVGITPNEHHLEERGITRVPLRSDPAHNLIKRGRPVNVKLEHRFLHPHHQFPKTQIH